MVTVTYGERQVADAPDTATIAPTQRPAAAQVLPRRDGTLALQLAEQLARELADEAEPDDDEHLAELQSPQPTARESAARPTSRKTARHDRERRDARRRK